MTEELLYHMATAMPIRTCFGWLIVYATLSKLMIFVTTADVQVCMDREPTRMEKRKLYLTHNLPTQFMIIPQVRTKMERQILEKSHVSEDFIKEMKKRRVETPLTDNTGCPSIINSNLKHQKDRSSCPWYAMMTVDQNRWPKVMAYAKCKCNNCIYKSSVHPNISKVSSNVCKPVYSFPLVLRRKCSDGKYNYVVVPERIAIGCTCVVPREKDN